MKVSIADQLAELAASAIRGKDTAEHALARATQERDEARAEVARLRDETANLKGAIAAQDEREREAGERCDVPHVLYGCDWPEVVADEVLALRLRAESAEYALGLRDATIEKLQRLLAAQEPRQ